jgi:hypothetical protein
MTSQHHINIEGIHERGALGNGFGARRYVTPLVIHEQAASILPDAPTVHQDSANCSKRRM